jgi:hypothetical protein
MTSVNRDADTKRCAECSSPIRVGTSEGGADADADSTDATGCVMLPRRGGLVCLSCARRCACGDDVAPGSFSIIDAATDRMMCDACAIRRFAEPPRRLPATDFSVRAEGDLGDPEREHPALQLSGCPRCDAGPGQRCVGIGRGEVHIERTWACERRWSSAN